VSIKYISEKIKDNLALIILLPTVFGGLWQIIELSKISISYIRFFSVTQLIPDGLLMLFIFSSLYISYKLGSLKKYRINFDRKIIIVNKKKPLNFINYFIKTSKSNKLTYSENPIYRKSIIYVEVAIVLIGIPSLWLLLSHYLFDKSNDFNFTSLAISIIFIILFGKMILVSLIILSVHILESKIFKIFKIYISNKLILKELVLFPIKLLVGIFFIALMFIPIYLFSLFHKNYFLPENLKNLENIQIYLKDYKKNEILYFNDKYIFIEHSNNDKNISIEILMFDRLFNKNNIINKTI